MRREVSGIRVEVRIDSGYAEPLVLVLTARMTDDVSALVARLSAAGPRIAGFKGGMVEVIAPEDILRIYAGAGRVYAVTARGEFTLRQRLYELETRLDPQCFVRISNSEIINLRHVMNFDLSISGTVCARMSDGSTTYASRRYVARVKDALGI